MCIVLILFAMIYCLFSKCIKNSTTSLRSLYITFYLRYKWSAFLGGTSSQAKGCSWGAEWTENPWLAKMRLQYNEA